MIAEAETNARRFAIIRLIRKPVLVLPKSTEYWMKNKLKDIKEGMGHVRMGLDKAPEEVKACLKENLEKIS